jgi:hypothetical protein
MVVGDSPGCFGIMVAWTSGSVDESWLTVDGTASVVAVERTSFADAVVASLGSSALAWLHPSLASVVGASDLEWLTVVAS